MQIVQIAVKDITIADTASSGSVDLSSDGFDLANTVVFRTYDVAATATVASAMCVDCYINEGAETVVAERIGTAGAMSVKAFLVEFGADTNVYKGTFTMPTGAPDTDQTATGTIPTAIVTTDAFCWAHWKATNDGLSGEQFSPAMACIRVNFADTTHVGFLRHTAGTISAITGHWFVVESSTLTVQHGTNSGSLANATHTFSVSPTVTLANSFLLASYATSEPQFPDQGLWAADLSADNTIQWRRGFGASTDCDLAWQIVSDSNVSVQRGTFAHTGTSTTATLSPAVSPSLSIARNTMCQSYDTASSAYLGDTSDARCNRIWLTTVTTPHDRVSAQTLTADASNIAIPWEAVTFPEESGEPSARRIFIIT